MRAPAAYVYAATRVDLGVPASPPPLPHGHASATPGWILIDEDVSSGAVRLTWRCEVEVFER